MPARRLQHLAPQLGGGGSALRERSGGT